MKYRNKAKIYKQTDTKYSFTEEEVFNGLKLAIVNEDHLKKNKLYFCSQ
mgnify:CR=1 FL=1